MAETSATEHDDGQNDDGKNGGTTSTTETPINLTQEEFKRRLDDRLARERAKYSDYGDLKAKAAEYDKLADARKTEAEKLAERLAAADAAAASVPQQVAEQLKTVLVELHSISDEDAELFLTASDPTLLRRQADRLVAQRAEQATTARKQGNQVPREGTKTSAPENDDRAIARSIFGASD